MQTRISVVTFADGRRAIELEETHVGGSETQAVYIYFRSGRLMPASELDGIPCDYWGQRESVSSEPLGLRSLLAEHSKTLG